MDTHTVESSVALLKKLRADFQSQLDTSVVAEIDAVIAELESASDFQNTKQPNDLGTRILYLAADVIRLATNITELMK